MFTYLRAWFSKDEKGVTVVEYAVMLTLITVALLAAIGILSGNVQAIFARISTALAGG